MRLSFRFTDWPLRAKLAALLAVASLLPLAVWAYLDLQQDKERLLDGTRRLLEARGDQIVHELDAFHRGYQRAIDRVARFPASVRFCASTPEQRTQQRDAMLGVLSAYPASDPGIRGIGLVDGHGRIVVATEPALVGLDLSDRPVVRDSLQGRPVISDPFVSSPGSGAVPTIAYTAPALGPDRQAMCVAVLWVRAAALWKTVRASDALAGPGSFAVVYDREGIRIAHTASDEAVFLPAGPLDAATLERLVASNRFGPRTRALLEDVRAFPEQFARARAAAPDPGVFRGFGPLNRSWAYGVARRFETVPWTVFYMLPEDVIAAQVNRATRERLILAAGIIAVAALVGLAFAASILRPVRRLTGAAAEIAGGNLAARVRASRRDELGQLGDSFDTMAEQIQAQTAQLRTSRDELERRVQERTADLRERDAALHRAHEMSKLAHVITRPDGSFDSWSETLPTLLGVTPVEMPQSTREWLGLLHEEDRARFRSASIEAAVTGAHKDIEYRLQHADGRWIQVRQVIEPMPEPPDGHGRVRWFSTLQDVSEQKQAQEALRESQQLLRAIIDNSAAVIYVKDLDGRYLMVNRRYEEIFRLDGAAIVGRTDHELFPKDAADAFRDMDRRVIDSDAPLIEEEVAPQPDGPRTYVSVKCPLRDLHGRVCGMFGISTDITDRARTEAALRASEERTRLIIDTALDAVVSMDAAGHIVGWSPQAEAIFGWTPAEAVGRSLAQTIIPPRDREAHQRGLERYLATGQAQVLNRRIEVTALHRDGHVFPIDLSITPIRHGDGVGFSAFVRDITDRKVAQARLQSQLQRLNLLDQITRAIGERQDLQSIYQVVIGSLEERLPVDFGCVCRHDATDNSLTVVRVGQRSHALARQLGLEPDARIEADQNGLARCTRGELVYEPDIGTVAFPFAQRLAGGGLRALVLTPLLSESRVFGILLVARVAPHSFGSADCEFLRQLSAHVALATQQAELHGALQQAYDDLRQSQQTLMQQERLRALGEMASGIAHDINNAISPAALYTESLLEREAGLSERGRSYLETIARAIADVAATVARMREFYRQRDAQLDVKTVKLEPLVQQVLELTRARWSDMPLQRGTVIRLNTELAPDTPPVLGVDSELREALINLLFNAVDAMPDGGVLTLRTRGTDGRAGSPVVPARCAVIEVCDSGVGMDESTRRRCLEPFFTTKGERGTGLGLAMVYGVAQRHGADIEIDSAVGQGTTVRLIFPAASGAGADATPVASGVAPAARLRILIVDDDPLLLRSLRDTLELDGHAVVAANGGQAGIEAFEAAAAKRDEAFDVVFTDLGMPHVDGRKVAAAVKAAADPPPVILLTGWGRRLAVDGETPVHVDQVLSKPPRLTEVRAALARVESRWPHAVLQGLQKEAS